MAIDMKELTLNLTLEEVNLILKALGKMPFVDVYEVIGRINKQANEQLKKTNSENKQKLE
ncbi:MAG: hypothetical protein EAZ97_09625 [Bacteroidetes bacterium]|nr:MAG: hypothetical protein EAZ97_09625 [Bacteroidota bacterium]